jgi:hypothetical protein
MSPSCGIIAPGQHSNHDHASIIRDDDMTSTTATEDTPLLRSERDSSTSQSPPSSSASSEIYRDAGIDGPKDAGLVDDLDSPNHKVTRKRAAAIVLSVYILIFLLGIMPSLIITSSPSYHLITTIQDLRVEARGFVL